MLIHSVPEQTKPPSSYEEMLERPRFQEELDDSQHRLKAILLRYHLPQSGPCGRSGCRQPHKDGFLVVTEDNLETNVGSTCGANIFGDEVWRFKVHELQQSEIRQSRIARARSLVHSKDEVSAQISSLYNVPFGFKWQKRLSEILRKVLGADLYESLQVDQRRQSLEVKESTELSEDEIAKRAALTGRPRSAFRYDTSTLGTLEPMPWLVFNPQERLITGIRDKLLDLKGVDFEGLATPKLKKLLKPFEDIEISLRDAKAACDSASKFLGSANMELLVSWIPPYKDMRRRALQEWLRTDEYENLKSGLG